jgi:hypothetical protein
MPFDIRVQPRLRPMVTGFPLDRQTASSAACLRPAVCRSSSHSRAARQASPAWTMAKPAAPHGSSSLLERLTVSGWQHLAALHPGHGQPQRECPPHLDDHRLPGDAFNVLARGLRAHPHPGRSQCPSPCSAMSTEARTAPHHFRPFRPPKAHPHPALWITHSKSLAFLPPGPVRSRDDPLPSARPLGHHKGV